MNRCAALLVLAACGGGSSAVPAGERVGKGIAAALAAADRERAPWRCAAPDGPTAADETLGAWTLSGRTLKRAKPQRTLTIGAIADAGGAAPSTVAALGRLKPKLASVDLVVALGGMGTTQQELEASLGAIADKAGYPVVAMPGDLEDAGALAAALQALRTRGQLVADGRLVQRIVTPEATIATIAGAGARGRLVAADGGCAYRAEDVGRVLEELTELSGLRVLATAEAPRLASHGEPTGELALTPGPDTAIDVVLHGPFEPAATRAKSGGRDGDAVTLTPGTADATPRLPGPAHVPTAGILVLQADSWSWKPVADAE